MPAPDPDRQVLALIAEEIGLRPTDLTRELRVSELGLDSLAFMELIVALEQALEVHLDTGRLLVDLSPNSTLGDFLDRLQGAIERPEPNTKPRP